MKISQAAKIWIDYDLILELMARIGMRIGEVLKLRFCGVQDRKLIIREPKMIA